MVLVQKIVAKSRHQQWFFTLEPLMIYLEPEFQVSSYSKITYKHIHNLDTYNYNSHTSTYTINSHIQVHTIIIHILELLLYIIISCSCIMHIKFSCSHNFTIYLQQVIQQKLAGGGRCLGPPLEDYFFQVRTSLELWPSSGFFWASSFFLLALIYQVRAWLSFHACWSSFSTRANLFSNF
jgi:hypothetical protein